MTENETAEILTEQSLEAAQASAPARRPAHPRRRRRILLLGVAGLGLAYWVGWQSPVTVVEHVVVAAHEASPPSRSGLPRGSRRSTGSPPWTPRRCAWGS
jgi:ferric-dicitrate binding protein FerR (iron transport regulator)